MKKRKRTNQPEVNNGPMADIAFLLLIFFLVVSTIQVDKGIRTQINKSFAETTKQSVYKIEIWINDNSHVMLKGSEVELDDLAMSLMEQYSVAPNQKNVLAIKSEREVPYQTFISVLDKSKISFRLFKDKLAQDEFNLNFDQLSNDMRETLNQKHPIAIAEEVL